MEYLGTDKPVNHIKPLVSVCVTTYQQVHYIEKCLDSILNQETDFPFEIIVGEDDSKDGTRDICCKYAEKHPDKIRLFLRSRTDVIHICGMPTGRHNFIENTKSSRGSYIALCEGDDYWTDPYKLQKQVDFIENNPNTVMVAHIARIISSDEQTTYGLLPGKKQNNFLNPKSVIRRGGGFFATNSILFNKTIIEPIPNWIYDFPVGDEALNLLALDKGKIGFINQTMSIYRRHAANSWSSERTTLPLIKICLYKKYISYYLKFFITKKSFVYLNRIPDRIFKIIRALAQWTYYKLRKPFMPRT